MAADSDFGTRLDGPPKAKHQPVLRPAFADSAVSPDPAQLHAFHATVLTHYREQGRTLPWRETQDPYAILVSEVMLQQTQVPRVLPKYAEFLSAFPTVAVLAAAPTARVLAAWQGLGYNRRALALHRVAQMVVSEYRGLIPDSPAALRALPGVGAATAAAVCVFAYHAPLAFIETNIRAAFIHFFFQECFSVPDAAILPLVELTLDRQDPRTWYYALMDYGVWVKKQFGNPSRRSRHHVAQSPFAGSHRQARAAVLRALLAAGPAAVCPPDVWRSLSSVTIEPAQVVAILEELTVEGFLERRDGAYLVAGAASEPPERLEKR